MRTRLLTISCWLAAAGSLALAAVAVGGGVPPARAAGMTAVKATTTQRLVGWGANGGGNLGDGKTSGGTTPVRVHLPSGTTVTSVRSGSATVALTSTGTVLAWGANQYGQLGDGGTKFASTPVRVKLPPGAKAVAVRAGALFAMALTSTGQIYAWGANADGQLGNGTTADGATDLPVPVALPAGADATRISAGADFAFAATSSGEVFGWGDNYSGTLGDGGTMSSDLPVEVDLPSGVQVSGLAAGTADGMAVTSTGSVYAWGDNSLGELGNGTTTDSYLPVPVHLPSGDRVTALSGGAGFAVALTSTGTALAWGDNSRGELGDGSHKAYSDLPVRVGLEPGTVTGVTAGFLSGYALTKRGHVYAWGENSSGQLGDGGTTNSRVPVKVKLPAGSTAVWIAAGPFSFDAFALIKGG